MLIIALLILSVMGVVISGAKFENVVTAEDQSAEVVLTTIMNKIYNTTHEPRHIKCERDKTHWLFLATSMFIIIIVEFIRIIVDAIAYYKLYTKNHKIV